MLGQKWMWWLPPQLWQTIEPMVGQAAATWPILLQSVQGREGHSKGLCLPWQSEQRTNFSV
jgi:hypothetical protein